MLVVQFPLEGDAQRQRAVGPPIMIACAKANAYEAFVIRRCLAAHRAKVKERKRIIAMRFAAWNMVF